MAGDGSVRKGALVVVERDGGPVYYGKWRDGLGRQVKRKLGPAWLRRTQQGRWVKRAGRARPPCLGHHDALALMWEQVARHEDALKRTLRRGDGPLTVGGLAEEWFADGERRRGLKPSTLRDYRQVLDAYVLPQLGAVALDRLSVDEVRAWHGQFAYGRTAEKVLMVVRAILAYGVRRKLLDVNPAAEVEQHPVSYSGDYELYSREEVDALVRAAASEQDGAICLTAALTGLRRGELLALRWRDVDFAGSTIRVRASYAAGHLTTPKSGKVRSVPMAPDASKALARLGQREHWIGDDDLVFVGETGGYLDGSALRRRYGVALERAGLRPLRFHDLRHTFGTRMIAKADIRRVQEWMGHADVQTTMRYLHYAPRADDAALVAEAFKTETIADASVRRLD
jgi:integrase